MPAGLTSYIVQIIPARKPEGMFEEIRVDFLGNDQRSHDSS
jgi:hypothetical protein